MRGVICRFHIGISLFVLAVASCQPPTHAEEPTLTVDELRQKIQSSVGAEQTNLKLLALTRFDVPVDFRMQVSDELIKEYESSSDPVILGKAYCGKGVAVFHRGRPESAVELLKTAEEYGRQCEAAAPEVFFKARCNHAACLTAMGDKRQATLLLQEAIEFARPYDDQLDVPFVYLLMSHHAEEVGAVDLALKFLHSAFEGAVKQQKANIAAQAGVNIIGMLALGEQFNEAEHWLLEAAPWVDKSTDPSVPITYEMYREDLRSSAGDPQTAIENLEKLVIKAKATSNPQFIGNVYLSLAAANNVAQKYEAAIDAADQAISYLGPYVRSLLIAKQHKLEAFFECDRLEEALAGIAEIVDLSRSEQSYPRWKAFDLKSRILRKLGDLDGALDALIECRKEEDLRLSERAREQDAFMRTLFDDQQRSTALALAKEKQQAAETRLELSNAFAARQTEIARHDRNLRNSVMVFSLLAFVIGIVLVRSIVNRKAAVALAAREHQLNVQLNEKLINQAAQLQSEVAARRQLELAMERKHRDESIGKLTGGVAHDFNNLLTVIMQSIELTKLMGGSLSPEVTQLLDSSLKAAESGAGIVSQLLAYARQQPLSPKRIQVSSWLESSRSMFRQIAGKGIQITESSPAIDATICVDSARLTTAIINLLANSRDAIDPVDGQVDLRIASVSLTESSCESWNDLVPGEYVLFEVSDNGKGMTSEQLERACEPFFSTKMQSAGTGLGLSSVLGFVKQSGGDFKLASKLGKGTTASIILPKIVELQTDAGAIAEGVNADASKRRILLVEDQPDVRFVIGLSLKAMGLDVVEASDADEAKTVLQKPNRPQWVLSDVRMPGSMNGIELKKWIQNHCEDVRVILMSGYSDVDLELESEAAYIQKPVKPQDLRRVFEAEVV